MFAVKLPAVQHDRFDLYWCQEGDNFCYMAGPRTLYETEAEAEGAILWIICHKGMHYFGNLEVVRAESETRAL